MEPQVRSAACPDDESLRAFALGDLPDDDIDALRLHLDDCPGCEARAEAIDDRTDHVLDELRRSLSDAARAREVPGEPAPPVDAGPPVLPDYVIEGPPIGVGSTGLIYKARHLKLGRTAALKMIARRPEVVSRLFEMEAKAVAQLQHPNIVQIYDIGSHGDQPFLALEFLDGGSLEGRIAGTPQDPRAAAETIRIVAEAVDHAHRQGIIHCDLKPSNILTTRDGVPKVSDFGVAKWTESDGYWGDEGGFRGTPRYMAPEQAGGAGAVGPATDVYSLGTILYEMLVGHVPHLGMTAAETLRCVREVEPAPPSRLRPCVPRDLDRIVLKCLRKAPAGRYPSAQGLADDLSRFLAGPSTSPRPSAGGRAFALVASMLATLAFARLGVDPDGQPFTSDLRPSIRPEDHLSKSPSGDAGLKAETVVQDDGSIRLGAASAVVSGESLRFEGSFGNLGYWHGREDSAAWTFFMEPEHASRYRLSLEYANRNGDSGNRFLVRVDDSPFERRAESTGGWSDYRTFPVAEIDLGPGFHTVEVRPCEPLSGALFDLRAVILGPVEE